MKYRTLVQARARKSPGLSGEVATLVPADALLTPVGGPSHADGLVWYPFQINGGQAWIAEATPSQTPILLLEADDPTIFDLAFAFVMAREGGYLSPDDAQTQGDPGGETKYGIAKRFHPDINIKLLTIAEAKEIYYREYWIDGGCHNLDPALALVHFDACVNCGGGMAQTFLTHNRERGYLAYCEDRRSYYKKIGEGKPQFISGWLARVDAVQAWASAIGN